MTTEDIAALKNEGYTFLGEELREKPSGRKETYIHIRHELCGKDYWCRRSKFFNEHQRCTCLRKRKTSLIKSNEDYQRLLDEKYRKGTYTLVGNFLGRKREITVRHSCGHEYTVKRAEFLMEDTGGRCPICTAGSANTKDILEAKFKRYGADLSLLEPFKPGKVKYKVANNKCKHQYYIYTYDILRDHGGEYQCPICTGVGSSSQERQLSTFLKTISPDFRKKRFKVNDMHSFEIDAYSASRKIGFEMDGLYWHSEKLVGPNYHYDKMKFFKDQGIRLINIFEDEWMFHGDIIKDKIRSILGVQKDRIYARTCHIKEVASSEKNAFLDTNHIQGADKANISLGLYDRDDRLVAVMTFVKLRRALGHKPEDGHYELSRFAGLMGYTIVGGFSKLLKYALKAYEIHEITTYADLRFTAQDSNVYEKNGFVLDHISKPSYYYTKYFKTREYRYTYRKSELKKKFPDIYSDDKSEAEIMREAGYSRVYDCGNLVYKLTIPH